jgi:hypothetical protein
LRKDDAPFGPQEFRPAMERRTGWNPHAAAAEGDKGIGKGGVGIVVTPPG